MIRVLTVFGTRPEAIKLAPVVRALEARPGEFASTVCVSAQHREMLDQAMQVFGVKPDFDLDLMRDSQSPSDVAGRLLSEMPRVLAAAQPDFVLVQGDTITTFAAAFAAYLHRIPVGHIEAGLRTGNPDHPFPEEMNRMLTTRVSALHFAPTTVAADALRAEGIEDTHIIVTGNTVIDALLSVIDADHAFAAGELTSVGADDEVVLITTHRRESFGAPLENICGAVRELARIHADHRFVLPVHPNPNVQSPVRAALGDVPNVILCDPLDYVDFANLMARSRMILTDSGGVQEEAPSLDVPVLVMRETTERPEGVSAGCSRLVGMDKARIVNAANAILGDARQHEQMARARSPYGDGAAASRIADAILMHETRFEAAS